jgi:predicted dehydrogenase
MKEYLDAKITDFKRPTGVTGPKKGVGVVGLHEGRTLLAAMNRTTLAFPVAGCDVEERKIENARREFPGLFYTKTYREMLARRDVDIVAIYTPDALHGQHIVQALDAGKDVICTKPLVNSLGDARRVLDALRRTGRKLMVGQSSRFFEPFIRQRAAYERGEVGDLELADAHYIHRMDWYYRKSPWAATDTDWVFLGLSHPVDLIRWYLGPIDSVHAAGSTSALGRQFGMKGYDIYLVNLTATDGRIGRAMGHYGLHELPRGRNCIELLLCGTKGTSLAQYHDMKYIHTAADGTEVLEDPLYERRHYYFNSEIHGMHYGEFANYTDYFAEAVITGAPYSPHGEEGIETFCVMEAIQRSARTGDVVKVGPILEEVGLGAR